MKKKNREKSTKETTEGSPADARVCRGSDAAFEFRTRPKAPDPR